MKIRNDLTSINSFIVAVRKNETKFKISFEIDLKDYLDYHDGEGKPTETVEELTRQFLYNCAENSLYEMKKNYPCLYEKYLESKRQIEKGNVIYFGTFNSDGEPIEQMLCQIGLNNIETSSEITVIDMNVINFIKSTTPH